MRLGSAQPDAMTASHTIRLRQDNTLGPAEDGHSYAIVHVTGYIKNWSPGKQPYIISLLDPEVTR